MKLPIESRAVLGIAAAMVMACNAELESGEPVTISKISPLAVSNPDAWRLFDRSTTSAFTAGNERIMVTLQGTAPIAALKVFGPAPTRLDVRGPDGSSLGFDPIDMSKLPPGWHVVSARAPTASSQVELRFEAVGAGGGTPEIELWAKDDHPAAARSIDLTAPGLPAGFASFAAASSSEIAPGDCADFAVEVSRSPAMFRRSYLVYEAGGLFRSFAIVRSIDGLGQQGGHWLAGDAGNRTIVDEIDPALLTSGARRVTLCVPETATTDVSVSKLRIIGELDRGVGQPARVTVGAHREGGAAIDGDATTVLDVAAGERVTISFDRLIAPDALELSGSVAETPEIDCLDRTGNRRTLSLDVHAAPTGKRLILDGGDLACTGLVATFRHHATISELDVVGSGARERVDWPRLVVNSAPEHFGTTAWVGGFVMRPSAMTGAIRVDVAGQVSAAMTGDFGRLLERTGAATAVWPVPITAHLPDGTTLEHQLVLYRDHASQLTSAVSRTATSGSTTHQSAISQNDERYGAVDETVTVLAPSNVASQIRLGTDVGVDIPAGALAQPTTITIKHLGDTDIPPLDAGMANVTAPKGHGFEFLPHGLQFAKGVEVIVPYDPDLLPEGKTVDDIRTFFFDPAAGTWKALERSAIDVGLHVTRSVTPHFTIMINAVLAVPTNPAPLSFDPTALSSIGAASPSAGIDLIGPPDASSTGEARTGLPIRVPEGRGAYTPSLSIGYSSSSGNSWLGVGWDLHISAVQIDTRWGVPAYTDGDGARYMIDGAPIVPTLDDDGPTCRSGGAGKRYHARIEGGFAHILRCGDSPSSFHWEIHDRDGTLFVYGESPDARLASYETTHTAGGIFRWGLERVVDVHGNTTQFHYTIDEDTSLAEPSRELYPASIDYTTSASLPAAYSIELQLDDATRPDRIVSGRAGFKVVTRHLLPRRPRSRTSATPTTPPATRPGSTTTSRRARSTTPCPGPPRSRSSTTASTGSSARPARAPSAATRPPPSS